MGDGLSVPFIVSWFTGVWITYKSENFFVEMVSRTLKRYILFLFVADPERN